MGFLNNILGKGGSERKKELETLRRLRGSDPSEFRVQKSAAAATLQRLLREDRAPQDPELTDARNRCALFQEADSPLRAPKDSLER